MANLPGVIRKRVTRATLQPRAHQSRWLDSDSITASHQGHGRQVTGTWRWSTSVSQAYLADDGAIGQRLPFIRLPSPDSCLLDSSPSFPSPRSCPSVEMAFKLIVPSPYPPYPPSRQLDRLGFFYFLCCQQRSELGELPFPVPLNYIWVGSLLSHKYKRDDAQDMYEVHDVLQQSQSRTTKQHPAAIPTSLKRSTTTVCSWPLLKILLST